MNDSDVVTPHDVSPELAISAIHSHRGLLLIDLDETLYLRNSTEDFIDCAHPRLPALLMLKMLELLSPWRWTGGAETRDVWRVNLIRTCFPFTSRFWRGRVPLLAAQFGNVRLLSALKPPEGHVVVTTLGFQCIVLPLVAALGLPQARIVATRKPGFADRRAGKLAMATGALGLSDVRKALVLTDSSQDIALLDACARPLRTTWPGAHYHVALSGIYLPGQYLTRIKRPGERYIIRSILQEDFAFWVLSSIALAASPAMHVLGLLFLLASFWTIYERGYVDNDAIASRFEARPKLSAAFADSRVATPPWQPWIWSAGLATVAIGLLRWPAPATLGDALRWALVLVATYGWFRCYNRYDKGTRIWLFAGLQLARAAALIALVPITTVGAVALGAHVLAKWVPYCIYRVSGADWPDAPFHLIRLMFFLVLVVLLAFAEGISAVLGGTVVALLAWNLLRARKELSSAWRIAARLDRESRPSGS